MKKNIDFFQPIILISVLIFFTLPLKYFFILSGMSVISGEIELSAINASLSILFYLSILFVYFIAKRLRCVRLSAISIINIFSNNKLTQKKNGFIFYLTMSTVSLLLVAYIILLYKSLSNMESIRPIDIKLAESNHIIISYIIKNLLVLVLTSFLAHLFYIKVAFNRLYKTKIIYVVFLIASFGLISGSRSAIIIGIFFTIIYFNNYFKKTLSFTRMASFAIVIILLLGYLGEIRQNRFDNIDLSSFNLGYVIKGIEKRFSYVTPNGDIYFNSNLSKQEPRLGVDYIYILQSFIPRSLYPEKPYSYVRYVNENLHFQSEGGTGLSPLIEGWANFGILGILLSSVIGGIILSITQLIYEKNKILRNPFILFTTHYLFFGLCITTIISPGITHNSVGLLILPIQLILTNIITRKVLYK